MGWEEGREGMGWECKGRKGQRGGKEMAEGRDGMGRGKERERKGLDVKGGMVMDWERR